MLVAVIPSWVAQDAIGELLSHGLVNRDNKVERSDGEVMVPVLTERIPDGLRAKYDIRFAEIEERSRGRRADPIEKVRDRLLSNDGFDRGLVHLLPNRWEMLGDVLILRLDRILLPAREAIAEAYAEALRAKSVLAEVGGIRGEERIPEMEIIWGHDAETTHNENGVLYCFDVSKIMFSSGNIDERVRMASIDCTGEAILDMFAGIGYLSLPMAVHQHPRRIYCCEIRRLSFDYLVRNIEINQVKDVVSPFCLDNRDFSPPEEMDRLIMGYLKDTHKFLPKALSCLKDGGIVHYHESCPNALYPDRPTESVKEIARGLGWRAEMLSRRTVKSYAPGVSHFVIDIRFRRS